MTETTSGKPPADQIANVAFTADHGGRIDAVGVIPTFRTARKQNWN
jgi:hypothetical protein